MCGGVFTALFSSIEQLLQYCRLYLILTTNRGPLEQESYCCMIALLTFSVKEEKWKGHLMIRLPGLRQLCGCHF